MTNVCGEEMTEPVWTELSVGYPYHYDSTGKNETTRLGCGMVWLSVKVSAYHSTIRDAADNRHSKGKWMIFKGALVVASLGVSLLSDFTTFFELFSSGETLGELGSVDADVGVEALGGVEALEVGETAGAALEEAAEGSGEEQKKSMKNIWKYLSGPAAGLAYMNVGRTARTKDVGVTFIIGHIRRGIYAGWRPSFKVESKVYTRSGGVSPPEDRVDPQVWEDFKRTKKFEKLVLLTLVDA